MNIRQFKTEPEQTKFWQKIKIKFMFIKLIIK